MAFFPALCDVETCQSESNAKALGNMLKSAASSAIDNLTGGLVSAVAGDKDIMKMRTEYIGKAIGQASIVNYIACAHSLTNDTATVPQLILDLSYYVQNASLPQLTLDDGELIKTPMGQFHTHGQFVKPSQNTFQLNIINTKAPLLERVFYPWMREVSLPYWAYDKQPYTTANVTIKFDKHADFGYMFVGSRPTNIETLQPSNDLGSPTRMVTFTFDHMFVTSKMKMSETVEEKLGGAVMGAISDLGSAFGL